MRTVYIGFILALLSGTAAAAALDSWPTWSTEQPYISKQVPPGALIMRGIGTDAYYVAEINATTGEIPVDIGSAEITVDFSGPTGAAVPADAAFMGGTDGGTLRGVHVDSSGDLQVDVLSSALPSGAATETTLSAINTKTPALGQAVMASSTPVVVASNQTDLPVVISAASTVSVENLPTTVSTDVGASDASTLRVSEGSRSYADSATLAYSSTNVTTGAWVEVDSSTAAAFNYVCITDQSGQILELGSGAALSEARVFLIARGFSGCIPLRIAASTRLSLRAVSATANSGDFVISGMQ
jgi:hypothetical protein